MVVQSDTLAQTELVPTMEGEKVSAQSCMVYVGYVAVGNDRRATISDSYTMCDVVSVSSPQDS